MQTNILKYSMISVSQWRNGIRNCKILSIALLGLLMFNCRKQLEFTEQDATDYGWELYAAGNYQESNQWFDEAIFIDTTYKDGYNGLGWTYGKLGKLFESTTNFKTGLLLAQKDTTDADLILLLSKPSHDVNRECTAGLSFVYHAKGDSAAHESAIYYGNSLLSMTGDTSYSVSTSAGAPNWKFSRDTSINSKHIIWIMASSYYATSNFEESLNYTKRLITDPDTFTPNINTIQGRQALAAMIESLRDNL